MIQMQTMLDAADNSGAKRLCCIKVLGGSRRRYAGVATSSSSASRRRSQRQGEEGDVHKAVVVRTVKEIGRADGSFLRFDQNSAVLVNPQGEPIGTRIFGPVARELRARKYMKIISLAPEVL